MPKISHTKKGQKKAEADIRAAGKKHGYTGERLDDYLYGTLQNVKKKQSKRKRKHG